MKERERGAKDKIFFGWRRGGKLDREEGGWTPSAKERNLRLENKLMAPD